MHRKITHLPLIIVEYLFLVFICFFQQFPENIVQYEPSTAKLSLQNPLMEPLEQCVIAVTGRGLIYRQRNYR